MHAEKYKKGTLNLNEQIQNKNCLVKWKEKYF